MVTVAFAAEQQRRQRLADEVRAPDHDRARALELDPRLAKELHHAGRRAGRDRLRHALHEQAGVDRGQPVDVLAPGRSPRSAGPGRGDRATAAARGSRARASSRVERFDQRRAAPPGRRRRRARGGRTRMPTSARVLALHPHVDRGGGVVADEDRRQPRRRRPHLGDSPRRRPARAPRAATALPSIIRAVTLSPLPDRRVVGHQLALGAVAGEADDDHPPRLDRGDDAVAEAGVDDVVAGAQLQRRAGIDRARGLDRGPGRPARRRRRPRSSCARSAPRAARRRSARAGCARRGRTAAARASRSCRGGGGRG